MKIVGVCLWLVLSFACKKEDDTSNCLKLEGVWQCESWIEDGEQFFGDTIFYTSAELTFKKLDGVQGDYTMDISSTFGGIEMIIGAYVVNEACDEVIITPKAGVPSVYDFTIAGDLLTLSGINNGVDFELKFRKD